MTNEKPGSNLFSKILGSAVLLGCLAIIALAVQIYSWRSDEMSAREQLKNQGTQIALHGLELTRQAEGLTRQAEGNEVNANSNKLLEEQTTANAQQALVINQQATVIFQQATIENELRTPYPTDNEGINLTATAIAYQATALANQSYAYEATSQAISEKQRFVEATQTALALAVPTPIPPPTPSYKLLGEWLYKQARAPMPQPANVGEVIFAHGDIDNSGTCHVKEFGPGEQVRGLGNGGFKLWLIIGPPEYIQQIESQLQSGAAAHAGTSCLALP